MKIRRHLSSYIARVVAIGLLEKGDINWVGPLCQMHSNNLFEDWIDNWIVSRPDLKHQSTASSDLS